MPINNAIRGLIAEHETAIYDEVLDELGRRFPDMKYSEEECIVDVHLILEAITNDIPCYSKNSAYAAYKVLALVNANRKFQYQSLYILATIKRYLLDYTSDVDVIEALNHRFKVVHQLTSSRIVTDVKWWTYLAKSLPLTALGMVVGTHLFLPDSVFHYLIMLIIVSFFTLTVSWWFWAIWTVAYVVLTVQSAHRTFNEVNANLAILRDGFITEE